MSDDLISRKALLKELREIMDEPHNTMFLMGIGAAVSIVEHRETAFDKKRVIEELENPRAQYFITIANTGDEKLGFAYKCIWNALDHAIKIVEKGGIE